MLTPALAPAKWVLGVHPYLAPREIQTRFAPLADYLAHYLQAPVQIRVATSYQDHILAIGRDRIDLAFIGPAAYVKLVNTYGPKPILGRLAIRGKPCFYGYIVVREDSDLNRLSALRGKRFSFGAPESTMGTLVPRDLLLQAGVPPEQLAFFQHLTGHENVALSVLAGAADAGAVKSEIFERYQPLGLRALARTACISEHLFITRGDLAPAQIERLRNGLLGLTPAEVAKVLAPIQAGVSGLVPARDEDYDPLRDIAQRWRQHRLEVGAP